MSSGEIGAETTDSWKESLRDERDAEAIYLALARAQTDPGRSALLERIAADERRHAAHWEAQLREAGVDPGDVRPGNRARILCRLAGDFGDTVVLPIMRDRERHATESYLDATSTFAEDEARHARELATLVGDARGEPIGTALARLQRGRAAGGNALRAAVLGVNDGLVSNAALIMGFAGADQPRSVILLAGISGLLAGAFSMAAGEYISMRIQREVLERMLHLEAHELGAEDLSEETAELTQIYRRKGLSDELARRVAEEVMKDPEVALETHAREELGIDPKEGLGSPVGAAASSFGMFAVGAIIPLIPFLFVGGTSGVLISAGLTAIALATVGALTSRLTGRSALVSALRMLAIGGGAAIVTYVIGSLVGVNVA